MPAAASYETLRERLRVLILAYSSTNTKRQGNPCLFAFSELAVVKKKKKIPEATIKQARESAKLIVSLVAYDNYF